MFSTLICGAVALPRWMDHQNGLHQRDSPLVFLFSRESRQILSQPVSQTDHCAINVHGIKNRPSRHLSRYGAAGLSYTTLHYILFLWCPVRVCQAANNGAKGGKVWVARRTPVCQWAVGLGPNGKTLRPAPLLVPDASHEDGTC